MSAYYCVEKINSPSEKNPASARTQGLAWVKCHFENVFIRSSKDTMYAFTGNIQGNIITRLDFCWSVSLWLSNVEIRNS